MRKSVIMITGANGEIGHGLITALGRRDDVSILALDVQPLDRSLQPYCERFVQGDILDTDLLGRLVAEFEIRSIFHLASILSTKAEYNPEAAHRVNVEGTLNLLRLALEQSRWQGYAVKFIYPSSIAVYGLPSNTAKCECSRVREDQYCEPTTMYGCNKLYCELLGRYYAHYYRQLSADRKANLLDFRCLRFPGLISAVTLPTGGTSDYAPEMVHFAAQGIPYPCFVRPDTTLPFMVMPDAVKSLIQIEAAPREALQRDVYNVTSFSLSAQQIYEIVRQAFPSADISFEVNEARQSIVDTWPAELDDSAARADWGWSPDYDVRRAFDEYLVPAVTERYAHPAVQ